MSDRARLGRLQKAARDAGQEHVFRFWDRLDDAGRERLLDQVGGLDFGLVSELGGKLNEPPLDSSGVSFEPPELFPLRRDAAHEERAGAHAESGARHLASGKVAYCLVAGGQASRLGYEGPKGNFPVGPVTGQTLYEVHARRLRAAGRRHGTPTPWYVMTSPANDAATRAAFEANAYFGLDPEDVFFFTQAMLPALDPQGRILLAGPGELFLAPNGHGGVLAALASSGALADMRRRGIETLSYFQVDNPLARPADPLFVGLHVEGGAGMSSKVVAKRDAGEKVGVLGRVDGRMGCIEYSDLPDDLRTATEPGGELLFRAGNIAVHLLQVDFVGRLTDGRLDLPWHLARKKMRVLDEGGERVEREGVKFETFVFDALARSETSVTLEVDRALEFSPVKNATGEDSPATARRDLCRLYADWVRTAGGPLPEPDAEGLHPVEVDPLVAESAEEFLALERPEPTVGERGHYYGP